MGGYVEVFHDPASSARVYCEEDGGSKKPPPNQQIGPHDVCVPGNCDRRLMWIVVEAAATDAERKQLTAMADGVRMSPIVSSHVGAS